jgi:hypothetical protein
MENVVTGENNSITHSERCNILKMKNNLNYISRVSSYCTANKHTVLTIKPVGSVQGNNK